MIIMSSKIRLDAMSKIISFSISDRYLDKLRSLYPNSTDNLAVKQFVTDRLDGSLDDALDDNLKTIIESSLSSTLDDVLDDRLDGQLKTIIETSLGDVLDERLDAVMGKLITSLSERLSRLEERLDTNLDGGLDVRLDYGLPYKPSKNELTETQRRCLESAQLARAKLEHAAYLVKHPLVVRDLTKEQPIETAIETVEAVTVKVESVNEDEPDTGAIGPVGMTAVDAAKYLEAKRVTVSYDSLNRWINNEKIPDTSPQGRDVRKHLILRGKLYYPIN